MSLDATQVSPQVTSKLILLEHREKKKKERKRNIEKYMPTLKYAGVVKLLTEFQVIL